jgi:hypothetical protein
MTTEQSNLFKRLQSAKKWGHDQYAGVYYDYDLCFDGMIATLFRESHHTENDIETAKRKFYRDHDVVRLKIKEVQS